MGDPDALAEYVADLVTIHADSRRYLVIGGGLSRASHLFLERAEAEARARALPALWKRVTVSLARGGADAGVIGAGVLAAQELDRDTDARPHRSEEGDR